jgi:exopolysaccharide biosynthesis WecB/TagA/CpsF family protein
MTIPALANLDSPLAGHLDPEAQRDICGVNVTAMTGVEAVQALADRLERRIHTPVGFVNAHCINTAMQQADYRAAIADFLLLPDGIGIDIGSRVLFGEAFPENLNGTDFVPYLLASLARPVRVALIGASEGIAERAAEAFARDNPRHTFLPIASGYFTEGAETELMLAKLKAARADIVLVALGVPRQELFIARHVGPQHAVLAIGVGALLDFMAGKVPRAPLVVRRLRLEWAYRLAIEPRRLWRRYVIGNPRFLLHIFAERRRRGVDAET